MGSISREYKVPVYKSVKFKFAFTYIAVMLFILLVLNIYPVCASEDMMFRSKKSSLSSQVSIISTTLSGLETLNGENVSRVMELIELTGITRCVITDDTGLSLYDTQENVQAERYVLFSPIVSALDGYDVFYSEYTGGAIHSTVAVPVMYSGKVIGSAYLYEYDETQAALLEDFQAVIRTISVIVAVLIIAISVLMAGGLTRRIKDILAGVRVIRQGDYGYRLKIKGRDEVAQLGNEFNNMTDTLEKTEAMRRRFVSDASHELKTPLASIRLLTDSILQTEEMDTQLAREFVSDIGHEAERLTRMTEKLLKITRLSAAAEERWHRVDISQVIETAIHMLRPLADTGNIRITFQPAKGCFMDGVEDDIYQVVFNLVENAIKYNVPGGEVRISVKSDGKVNTLCVDDTGIGIPEADKPRVFERFYRVDKARSRETGGSGLGLSIVNDTVGKYGGSVAVSGSDLGGTRFTVTLPAAEEAEI